MAFNAVHESGNRIRITNQHSSSGSPEDLSERIRMAYNELSPSSEHHIILSSFMEGAFALDLKVPKMPLSEVRNALVFEIQRQIPLHLDTLAWNYRIIGREANHLLIRIFFVKDEVWKKTLSAIMDSGIKIDSYMHPLLCEHGANGIPAEDATGLFQELTRNFASD